MSTTQNETSGSALWTGRPWILPSALARTVAILLLAAIVIWLESAFNAANLFLGMPLWTWTVLLFLVVWLVSLIPLLVLRSAHKYTLRSGSLEIKTGIASTRNFVLASSGFSDLEVTQSLIGRIVNSGDILIHTQSDRTATMQMVKNPNSVANQIRDFMGKPIVRIENQPPPENKP